MSGQFYWAWQLAAKPSLVYDALSTGRNSVDTARPHAAYFRYLLTNILSLMGYSPDKGDDFVHWRIPNKSIVISSKEMNKRGGQVQFFCSISCEGHVSTVLAIEEDLNAPASKDNKIRWILNLIQNVAQRIPMPRPRYGCLFVLGEDFGCTRVAAHQFYDILLLNRTSASSKPNKDLYINPPLRRFHNLEPGSLFTFHATNDNELVEYTVIRGQNRETILEVVRLFFSMGYDSPLCIFSGHGVKETGDLVVKAAHPNDSNRSTYATISFKELRAAVDVYCTDPSSLCEERQRIRPPAHLGSSLVILNSSYAHLYAPSPATHSPHSSPAHSVPPCDLSTDGTCVHKILPLTSPTTPLVPTGGLIKYLQTQQHLLPEQYDHALPFVRTTTAIPLIPMPRHCVTFTQSLCPFTFHKKSLLTVPAHAITAKSGVYVFQGLEHDVLSYVIFDSITQHALLVDGGDDAAMFYKSVWMGFIMPYVQSFDVVLSRPHCASTTGIVALFASKSFAKSQRAHQRAHGLPRCDNLFVNIPKENTSVWKDMGLYSDVIMIKSLARKLGVTVVEQVLAGNALYSSQERSLHASMSIRVDILAPLEKATAYITGSIAAVTATASPSRHASAELPTVPTLFATRPPLPPPIHTEDEVVNARVRREPEEAIALLVRARTKVVKAPTARVVQYILGPGVPLPSPSARERNHNSEVEPWLRFLPFPPDY